MVEIGGKPILWHIMKSYSNFGYNEFIICCGYKGYVIKEYFANYFLHTSDVTFHMDRDNQLEIHRRKSEPWKVTLVDTGETSMTGGRLARVASYLDDDDFCFTYGDGLADGGDLLSAGLLALFPGGLLLLARSLQGSEEVGSVIGLLLGILSSVLLDVIFIM